MELNYRGLILVAIQIIACILYYLYTSRTFRVQQSISDVFWRSQDKYGPTSVVPWLLFYGFLLAVGLPFHIMILSGWSFFAMVGLIFIGTAAQYWRDDLTRRVHYVGAIGGVLLAFVALGMKMWIISLIFFIIYLLLLWLLRSARFFIWWVEWIALLFVIVLEVVYLHI